MKLASLGQFGIGVVTGDEIVPVESRSMAEVLEHWEGIKDQLAGLSTSPNRKPLSSVRLGPPVPNPSKIWAAAGNYRRGSNDLGQGAGRGRSSEAPEALLDVIFLKPPSAITGPASTINIPGNAETIFPELELCVVMGRKCRDLAPDQVEEAIFGYTIILDVTARGYGSQGNLAATRNVRKGFDTFAPIGPWIVTRDEIPNPEALSMKLWVNGELRQSAKTDAMINGIPALVSYLSRVATFLPGDLIATGNPDAPDFQQQLKPGDELTAEIEGIGSMTLTVA